MKPPILAATIREAREALETPRRRGKTIGLVPTMGALHAGHAQLLATARQACDLVVVSIFVNPTQFGPKEDFSRYPRPFEKDVEVCVREGVDLIFHPAPSEMYPAGHQTFVEVSDLQKPLCGASRPGHFRGVATVVLKLLNIVQPTIAYFGQKDAQQARLLAQMVHDLDVPVWVEICPTVRESDGLALSSRNQYLSADQRQNATVLYQVLEMMRTRIGAGERSAEKLLSAAHAMIVATPGARLDYVDLVSWQTLTPIATLEGEILAALAVYFGSTRLIDNMRLSIA